ncbi:hypothetical protein ACFL6T_01800 [Candidatus Zixiibacteriota bacterium]
MRPRYEGTIMRKPLPAIRSILAVTIICLACAAPEAGAQEESLQPPSAEYSQGLQFTSLANMPIAGLLERGSFEVDLRMYPEGGLFTFVTIGLFKSMNIGISYGADNVIGRGKVTWNPNVEAAVKLRVISETVHLPAIAVGYASQGYGPWLGEKSLGDEDPDRYMVKSPGLYAVASKNWRFLFEFGTHFGINKSFENADDDDLNAFIGADISLNPEFYFLAEYDLAINDNHKVNSLGYKNGYLNVGVKWAATPRLRLELIFTNLLDNVRKADKAATIQNLAETLGGAGREIRIVYTDWF